MQSIENGTVTSPKGFRASGVVAGIKQSGTPDVALVVSDRPGACAAVFTKNRVQAAPIRVCKEHMASHGNRIQAVVINSGNANAVTGKEGQDNAHMTTDFAATELGISSGRVLVMSTGVIGAQLPMPKMVRGIRAAIKELSYDGGHAAARAIMTTDTRPKEIAVKVGEVTIGGICKGAAMMHPNMATMLAVLTTDALIAQDDLQAMLNAAINRSFNRISVDGDTSTNDTVALLANGVSGVMPERDAFQAALNFVCAELAKLIVKDAEGASKFVTINVTGAASEADAHQVASTIATSPLVKTAIYGRDANWGRVLAAAGRSGVAVEPERISLRFGPLPVLKDGTPLPFSEAEALQILSEDEIEIALDLGLGPASATMWTCDLTHKYIELNADYRT